MKIYLARPISGHSYDEIVDYYERTSAFLKHIGYQVLSPMTGKEVLRNEIQFKSEGYQNPVSTNHAVIERDRWMVDTSNIVYANLIDSKHVSIGTTMELAWGHDKGKHTIVAMEKDNIHRHAFIIESADVIFETNEDALNYLSFLIQK